MLAGSAKWIRCWDWHWSRPSATALAKENVWNYWDISKVNRQNRHNLNSSGLWNYHNYHQVLKLDIFFALAKLTAAEKEIADPEEFRPPKKRNPTTHWGTPSCRSLLQKFRLHGAVYTIDVENDLQEPPGTNHCIFFWLCHLYYSKVKKQNMKSCRNSRGSRPQFFAARGAQWIHWDPLKPRVDPWMQLLWTVGTLAEVSRAHILSDRRRNLDMSWIVCVVFTDQIRAPTHNTYLMYHLWVFVCTSNVHIFYL